MAYGNYNNYERGGYSRSYSRPTYQRGYSNAGYTRAYKPRSYSRAGYSGYSGYKPKTYRRSSTTAKKMYAKKGSSRSAGYAKKKKTMVPKDSLDISVVKSVSMQGSESPDVMGDSNVVLMRMTPITQYDIPYYTPTFDGTTKKFHGVTEKVEIEFLEECVVNHRRIVFQLPGMQEVLRGTTVIPINADAPEYWARDGAHGFSSPLFRTWAHKLFLTPTVRNLLRGEVDKGVAQVVSDQRESYTRTVSGATMKKTYYTALDKKVTYAKNSVGGNGSSLAAAMSQLAATYALDIYVLGAPEDKVIPGPTVAAPAVNIPLRTAKVNAKATKVKAEPKIKQERKSSDSSYSEVDTPMDTDEPQDASSRGSVSLELHGLVPFVDDPDDDSNPRKARIYSTTSIYMFKETKA
jgi:hypothetical protein